MLQVIPEFIELQDDLDHTIEHLYDGKLLSELGVKQLCKKVSDHLQIQMNIDHLKTQIKQDPVYSLICIILGTRNIER